MNQLIEWIPGREWRLRSTARTFIGTIKNQPQGLACFNEKGALLGHAKSLDEAQSLIENPQTETNENACS